MAFSFILLCFFIWLDEIIDIPYLLFRGESTPINWIEAMSESFIILGIGAFSVSQLARNIVERERAESRVRKERMFSNTIIQASPVFFVAINPQGKVMMMNDEMLNVVGYSQDEIAGMDYISTFVPAQDHGTYLKITKELMESHTATHNENHILTKDGRELLVEWFGRPIFSEDGSLDFFFGLGVDITQRKHVENELNNYQEQLRNLNIHTEQVRENERVRIARELHDELGQLLTVLKMDLAYVERKYSKSQQHLQEKLSEMKSRVDLTMQSLKRICTDLRPSLLDSLGLVAAVEWQADDFYAHTGIKCHVTIEPDDMCIDPNMSTIVFRIFQETITNVARHAKADIIDVILEKKNHKVVLMVKDNGIGISSDQISNSKSYGLMGIRERVRFRRGDVKIEGEPGKGTTVLVTIPLDKSTSIDNII